MPAATPKWKGLRRRAAQPHGGAAILGTLADRIRRKWMVAGSTFGFGLMSFLSAHVATFDELAILRFLTGIGLGGALTNVVALTAEYARFLVSRNSDQSRIRALMRAWRRT
ncbi:MFS transporter [Ancylobacter radicis]|uniref:MFS transporter n=1 Tax=Ancylobacter radicis TaxID=2836179 RepID=A0ABS5R928_9HYPH|nr:MFS transporter [Ancylobacter radicis]